MIALELDRFDVSTSPAVVWMEQAGKRFAVAEKLRGLIGFP
jgi:hypothetical protein